MIYDHVSFNPSVACDRILHAFCIDPIITRQSAIEPTFKGVWSDGSEFCPVAAP